MVLLIVPNLQALRHWLLRLDARLVTEELQLKWLSREKQARQEARAVDVAMATSWPVGVAVRAHGGEA